MQSRLKNALACTDWRGMVPTMKTLRPLIAAMPFATGCVVVNRYSVIDPSQFSAPLHDGNLTACLLAVAACSGVMGGIVAWLVARARHRNATG